MADEMRLAELATWLKENKGGTIRMRNAGSYMVEVEARDGIGGLGFGTTPEKAALRAIHDFETNRLLRPELRRGARVRLAAS